MAAAVDSLFNPAWYRVANLAPRLRSHVRIERRVTRGERWYLLIDDLTQRVHRLNAQAWAFAGRCDGERSVDAIWASLLEHAPEEAPTQGEAMQLLTHLHEAGVMQVELPAGEQPLRAPSKSRRRDPWWHTLNPFSFRVRLGNPSRLLDAAQRRIGGLLGPAALMLWLLLVAFAALAALSEWNALAAHGRRWLAVRQNLAVLWILYPLIKCVHELSHGLAVRRFGGQVREFGVTMLCLTPMPYVDASAANGFRLRRQRALVSAAGIMTELGIASFAMLAWLSLEDGLARDLALATMLIGAASTLLANGNPLVRMDGYHLLSDLLDLSNLAGRSQRWYFSRLQAALGMPAPAMAVGRGETLWLVLYGPCSWTYRAVVSAWLVSWLGSLHAWLGYGCAAVLAWPLLGSPVLQLVNGARSPALADAVRRRARRRLVLLTAGLAGAMAGLPLPSTSTAQGLVWLPEDAWLRAETDGFVHRLLLPDGAVVDKGTPVIELADDQLAADLSAARARLDVLQTQVQAAVQQDAAQVAALQVQQAAAQADVDRLEARTRALVIRAPAAGLLAIDQAPDAIGRFVNRGGVLGRVIEPANRTVRVALVHEDALRVAGEARSIEMQLADQPDRVLRANHDVRIASASHQLPGRALGQSSGGELLVDPADADGLTARDAVAVFDLKADAPLGERIGTRVWVRFRFDDEPLVAQGLRRARQALLRRFNPS